MISCKTFGDNPTWLQKVVSVNHYNNDVLQFACCVYNKDMELSGTLFIEHVIHVYHCKVHTICLLLGWTGLLCTDERSNPSMGGKCCTGLLYTSGVVCPHGQ